jgi:FKBP-type peptidyl-prolyl cis-trans isomerase 2
MRINSCRWITGVLCFVLTGCDVVDRLGWGGKKVQDGSRVSLEYTLSDSDGKLIESNKGKDPLQYVQGRKQIIPGLEKELAGMKVGGEKKVQVQPEEAYGPVDPAAFRELPRENIPPEALKVGTQVTVSTPQGQSFPVRVHEIREKTVVMDLNHPLAGKALTFEVKILQIDEPEKNSP